MTPLHRLFESFLPSWLVWPALCLAYTGMIAAILLFEQPLDDPIIYIDFRN